VLAVIHQAPLRTDVAAPYLSWLVSGQRFDQVRAVCVRIDRIRPGDPVCLWFDGIAHLSDPATEKQGFQQMRRALEAGVDRVVPIDAKARQSVEAATAEATARQ
jgi:hypothetical protein